MAGLYFHIPFCRRRCNYCDFYFVTNAALIERFLSALEQEVVSKSHRFEKQTIETIYFGGGTPSMLSSAQLNRILNLVRNRFALAADLEITLEANPEDLSKTALQDLSSIGINRLSIGVQAFNDKKLKILSREHTSEQSRVCLEIAREYFTNLSLDLIFGIEGETLSDWQRELDLAVEISPEHISAYSLTVEPFTPLFKLIQRGKRQAPIESLQAEMLLRTIHFLEASGYEQYEISNYSKPNKRSCHNSSYWNRTPYLGFGPAAHSFFREEGNEIRAANQPNLQAYLQNPLAIEAMRERLSEIDVFNETVLLSLRQRKGLDLELLKKNHNFAASYLEEKKIMISELQNRELITVDHSSLKLTLNGLTLADTIAGEFFIT